MSLPTKRSLSFTWIILILGFIAVAIKFFSIFERNNILFHTVASHLNLHQSLVPQNQYQNQLFICEILKNSPALNPKLTEFCVSNSQRVNRIEAECKNYKAQADFRVQATSAKYLWTSLRIFLVAFLFTS